MAINPFLITDGRKVRKYSDDMRGMFGGNKHYLDPYTTGYHFIYFFLPKTLAKESGVGEFLTTVCQQVSIPGITVNPIEYNGLNDMKWYVPGTTVLERNTFECTFIEMEGIPVTTILGRWITLFRNVLYGIADPGVFTDFTNNAQESESHYSQGNYKGKVVYATTLPDAATVQFAAVFTGAFPTKIPTDIFESQRATQEKKEVQITFQFDQMLTGTEVNNYAKKLVTTVRQNSINAVGNSGNEGFFAEDLADTNFNDLT